ncbi:MAG: hypothetical protein ACKVX7_08800 [Planctomycetota bacterium]
MSKSVKSLIMKDMARQFGTVEEAVFIDISRLDGVSNNRMRTGSNKQSIRLLATPFNLAKRVLCDLGWKIEGPLAGPTTIAWGPDIVSLAKQAVKWEKEFPGSLLKGGYVAGQSINADEVKILSESPSKEELIAIIVGGLLAASTCAVGAVNAQAVALAGQVKQISGRI